MNNTYKISYVKDINNNNYLAIKINKIIVEPFLEELKEYLSYDDYNIFVDKQQKRDKGNYHLTVMNVPEFNKILSDFNNNPDEIEKNILNIDIKDLILKGIGKASDNKDNIAYFIVCESKKLDYIREKYGLDNKDFHITLGFNKKDVHGVSKKEIISKKSKFVKKISEELMDDESWNFIKKIENFNLKKNKEIVPVSINDSYIKFRIDNNYIDVGVLENEENLRILTKYISDKKLPRMPKTKILDFLFNNK